MNLYERSLMMLSILKSPKFNLISPIKCESYVLNILDIETFIKLSNFNISDLLGAMASLEYIIKGKQYDLSKLTDISSEDALLLLL